MSVTLEQTARQSVGMGQIVYAQSGELTAILVSCIGLFLYHPRTRTMALGHIVLPESSLRDGPPGKYADSAVPYMVKLFRDQGIAPGALVAKIAGGAAMFGRPGPLQIGNSNSEAVKRYLGQHGLSVQGEHVGGTKGRRLTATAETGRLQIEIIGEPLILI